MASRGGGSHGALLYSSTLVEIVIVGAWCGDGAEHPRDRTIWARARQPKGEAKEFKRTSHAPPQRILKKKPVAMMYDPPPMSTLLLDYVSIFQ